VKADVRPQPRPRPESGCSVWPSAPRPQTKPPPPAQKSPSTGANSSTKQCAPRCAIPIHRGKRNDGGHLRALGRFEPPIKGKRQAVRQISTRSGKQLGCDSRATVIQGVIYARTVQLRTAQQRARKHPCAPTSGWSAPVINRKHQRVTNSAAFVRGQNGAPQARIQIHFYAIRLADKRYSPQPHDRITGIENPPTSAGCLDNRPERQAGWAEDALRV